MAEQSAFAALFQPALCPAGLPIKSAPLIVVSYFFHFMPPHDALIAVACLSMALDRTPIAWRPWAAVQTIRST